MWEASRSFSYQLTQIQVSPNFGRQLLYSGQLYFFGLLSGTMSMKGQLISTKWYVSYLNFLEVRANFKIPKKVLIQDITLRDGEQQAGLVFTQKDKIKIANLLDEVGVDRIEAGMPAVSNQDKERAR